MKEPTWKGFFVILTMSIAIVLLVMSPMILDSYTDLKIIELLRDNFTDPSYDKEDKNIVIFASGKNEKEILETLRNIYSVAQKTKRIDNITVFIENKENGMLISSRVEVSEFKRIKWSEIKTYEEFKEKANIIQSKL